MFGDSSLSYRRIGGQTKPVVWYRILNPKCQGSQKMKLTLSGGDQVVDAKMMFEATETSNIARSPAVLDREHHEQTTAWSR